MVISVRASSDWFSRMASCSLRQTVETQSGFSDGLKGIIGGEHPVADCVHNLFF